MPARVLVVDDSPVARAMYLDLLGDAGYAAEAVDDGAAALGVLDRCMSDVIVLDMEMPTLGGIEVLKRLSARSAELPPIVVVSGIDSAEREALALGARAFLRKPVTGPDLVDVIEAALAGVRCAWG